MRKLIIALAMMLASCGLIKQSTKNREDHQYELTAASQSKTDEQAEKLALTDSIFNSDEFMDTSFDLFLWPNGNIKYSIDGGFEGSFDSVLLKGKRRQTINSSGKLLKKTKEKSTVASRLTRQLAVQTADKKLSKQSVPDGKWILGLLILLIALFIYARKWLFSRNKK